MVNLLLKGCHLNTTSIGVEQYRSNKRHTHTQRSHNVEVEEPKRENKMKLIRAWLS